MLRSVSFIATMRPLGSLSRWYLLVSTMAFDVDGSSNVSRHRWMRALDTPTASAISASVFPACHSWNSFLSVYLFFRRCLLFLGGFLGVLGLHGAICRAFHLPYERPMAVAARTSSSSLLMMQSHHRSNSFILL